VYLQFLSGFPGLFLKASASAASFLGWLGLVFCREKPNRRTTRLIEAG
jgi:hypothetical protein